MSFIDMLFTEVKPLAIRGPEEKYQERNALLSEHAKSNSNLSRPNQLKRDAAIAKFKAVMPEEWTSIIVIAKGLNSTREVCTPTLRKWERAGLVVSRKSGGDENWNRVKGLEWKWVPVEK